MTFEWRCFWPLSDGAVDLREVKTGGWRERSPRVDEYAVIDAWRGLKLRGGETCELKVRRAGKKIPSGRFFMLVHASALI